MSTWKEREIECPFCNAKLVVRLATGLHITRLPHVHQKILDGTLHRFECTACGLDIEVRQPLIYTDFDRGIWIEVRPAQDIVDWRVLAPACAELFRRAVERGAPILRERTSAFQTRLVFGYDELREKVLLADAGVDDAAVECVKLLAVRRDPSLFGVSDRLLVQSVTDDVLTIERHRDDVPPSSFDIVATRADLTRIRGEVEAAIEPPFCDPFVSLNRAIGRFAAVTVSGRGPHAGRSDRTTS